jgi:hypothetical protein
MTKEGLFLRVPRGVERGAGRPAGTLFRGQKFGFEELKFLFRDLKFAFSEFWAICIFFLFFFQKNWIFRRKWDIIYRYRSLVQKPAGFGAGRFTWVSIKEGPRRSAVSYQDPHCYRGLALR